MRGLCCVVGAVLAIAHAYADKKAYAGPIMAGRALESAKLATEAPNRAGYPLVAHAQVPMDGKGDDFAVADVVGQAGTPIPLSIYTGLDETTGDLFALSGVPRDVMLSAGGKRNDLWIVRQKDISSLKLTAAKGYSGTFRVSVTRAQSPARPERTLVFTVNISDQLVETHSTRGQTTAATAIDVAPPAARKQVPAYVASDEERMLFERADAQLKKGDVAGARAIFEYLASKGNPAATFAVGETYDSLFLEKLFIAGVTGDAKKALEWYRRAEKLGNAEAQARLDALGQR